MYVCMYVSNTHKVVFTELLFWVAWNAPSSFRMLTAIELFENVHYYAYHPHFRKALLSGCPFRDATKEPGMAK